MMTTALLTLKADYESMRAIGPWLEEQVQAIGADHLAGRVSEFELAVHELAVNIVDHAFDDETRAGATFDITMHCNDDKALVVNFVDRGIAYDSADKPVVGDEPTIRGYGLFIVEQLATSIDYARRDDANYWTLVFGG